MGFWQLLALPVQSSVSATCPCSDLKPTRHLRPHLPPLKPRSYRRALTRAVLKAASHSNPQACRTADVVVVGGGAAGLTAAYFAATQGAQVTFRPRRELLGLLRICCGADPSILCCHTRHSGKFQAQIWVAELGMQLLMCESDHTWHLMPVLGIA